jgi:glycosyltransferase involved in cell wall biosynthesis
MITSLMNSPRKGYGRPSVLLDMRPLQGRSAVRGVGAYARGLLGGLIQAGFDANLTLLIDERLDPPDMPAGEYRIARCRRRSHGQFAAYEDALVLAADIAKVGPDVYHAIDFRLPRRTRSALVVTLHDLIPWVWGGGRMRGERLRFLLSRRLLRHADLVIAVSSSTAADATRLQVTEPSRVRVIPEAADPVFQPREGASSRVRARFGLDGPFLLFVGALDARKDPAALLGAWQTARRDDGDLKLVITGPPGKQAPAIMPGAVQLGLVGSDALADLYSAAGCLVFPSRYEGFGLPCVEAMACGCPVAAFRNSSLPEVVDDAGLLVDDGDVDALGRAAARMVHERDQWRAAGIERAKKLSWLSTAQATISTYESVLR